MGYRGNKVGVGDCPVFYKMVVGRVGCMLSESKLFPCVVEVAYLRSCLFAKWELTVCRVGVTFLRSWICRGDDIGDEESL